MTYGKCSVRRGPTRGGSEGRECGVGNCRTVQIRGTWYKKKLAPNCNVKMFTIQGKNLGYVVIKKASTNL
jgi:hypothetical protein